MPRLEPFVASPLMNPVVSAVADAVCVASVNQFQESATRKRFLFLSTTANSCRFPSMGSHVALYASMRLVDSIDKKMQQACIRSTRMQIVHEIIRNNARSCSPCFTEFASFATGCGLLQAQRSSQAFVTSAPLTFQVLRSHGVANASTYCCFLKLKSLVWIRSAVPFVVCQRNLCRRCV